MTTVETDRFLKASFPDTPVDLAADPEIDSVDLLLQRYPRGGLGQALNSLAVWHRRSALAELNNGQPSRILALRLALDQFCQDPRLPRLIRRQEELRFQNLIADSAHIDHLLTLGNLGLIAKEVGKLKDHANFRDIFQEVVLKLPAKFDKHDPVKGAFTTYITYWIRQMIGEAKNTMYSVVQVPETTVSVLEKIWNHPYEGEALTFLGATPNLNQLYDELRRRGVSPEIAAIATGRQLAIIGPIVSLDQPTEATDGDKTIVEVVEDQSVDVDEEGLSLAESLATKRDLQAEIKHLLSDLEQQVVNLLFTETRTDTTDRRDPRLEDVGGMLGLSREWIRIIRMSALLKLKFRTNYIPKRMAIIVSSDKFIQKYGDFTQFNSIDELARLVYDSEDQLTCFLEAKKAAEEPIRGYLDSSLPCYHNIE